MSPYLLNLGFNKEATFENASEWLDEIISAFLIADIPEYRSFIDLIKKYKPYILNSFKRPYDNRSFQMHYLKISTVRSELIPVSQEMLPISPDLERG